MPEDDDGVRSWIVQYETTLTFLITELPTAVEPFKRLGEKEDSKKRQTYEATASKLRDEGKMVKVMLFRNLKEERFRGSAQLEGDFSEWPREQLESDY